MKLTIFIFIYRMHDRDFPRLFVVNLAYFWPEKKSLMMQNKSLLNTKKTPTIYD